MVNLLWFRTAAEGPTGTQDAKADAPKAYYEGYVGPFVGIKQQLGIEGVEVAFNATQAAGLVRAPGDDWDDDVVVRYRSFADLRRIIESEAYERLAASIRRAAFANWRLTATRSR